MQPMVFPVRLIDGNEQWRTSDTTLKDVETAPPTIRTRSNGIPISLAVHNQSLCPNIICCSANTTSKHDVDWIRESSEHLNYETWQLITGQPASTLYHIFHFRCVSHYQEKLNYLLEGDGVDWSPVALLTSARIARLSAASPRQARTSGLQRSPDNSRLPLGVHKLVGPEPTPTQCATRALANKALKDTLPCFDTACVLFMVLGSDSDKLPRAREEIARNTFRLGIHELHWAWLDYSPATLANWARSPAWSLLDFRVWEWCRAMPLVGGFPRGSPVSPRPFVPSMSSSGIKGWWGGGETGDPRETTPTSVIVRRDSHTRNSLANRPVIEPGSPRWEASCLTAHFKKRHEVIILQVQQLNVLVAATRTRHKGRHRPANAAASKKEGRWMATNVDPTRAR
ncbi:hypothetical protein PR048_030241 [Dryococelus australis]|uniref:Uncharacterized protein n=1 Tax=Dryococelus australis TaxID=614101 RepID=A0ABQ9G8E9_9NEOP|nr:hypothetical protein PR048_030241 [Dryococelus australis]